MKARGSYHRYSPKVHVALGKYTSTNGVSTVSRFFSGKLKHHVSTSRVLSEKESHMKERKRGEERTVDIVKFSSFLGYHVVDRFYSEM